MFEKAVLFLKKEWKNEFQVALLAGLLSGIIALIGLLFITPERWYLSFAIMAVMTGVTFAKSVSDKKKNSGKYERDEHLVPFPWFYSAEGYLRESSDRDAKFYFGEEKIAALYYNNVRPLIKEFDKSKIKAGYFDRCGWFSIVVEDEKSRIVIPKNEAENAAAAIQEILGERE